MSARDVIADVAFEGKVLGHPVRFEMGHSKADAILSALRSAGFAVVPVEPTEDMRAACSEAAQGTLSEMSMKYIVGEAKVYITGSFDEAAVWRAMLKAAQEDSRERVATY